MDLDRLLPALVVAVSLLSACSSLTRAGAQQTLTRSALSGVASIEIVKGTTPQLQVKTLSGAILTSFGGLLTAPIGVSQDATATKKTHGQVSLPDFGELLVRKFAERAPTEVPGWPNTTVTYDSPKKDRAAKGGAILSFELDRLWLTVYGGLAVEVTGILSDANGKTLWRKFFGYRSRDFGRFRPMEEFQKDPALLVREIELAANDTATVLLQDIERGL